MLEIFGSLKSVVKVEKLCIDNNIFRLHYKLTVIILIALSIVVTSRQYIGDPIDCIVDADIPPKVMDTYCWIYSTFTIPNKLTGRIGKDVAFPGVSSHIREDDEIKYHKYYQWVCFVLLFQSISFYIPRYLWKTWENGRLKSLILSLNEPVVTEKVKNERRETLKMYFTRNMGSHESYFYKFFICEILNFVNVLSQIFLTDLFLDGEFMSYGYQVSRYNQGLLDENEDPMAKVFPKVTKCTFSKYGPSGTVQNFEGLCVLPVNILNEKIYVFIWYWFWILTGLSAAVIIYRILCLISSAIRIKALSLNCTCQRDLKQIEKKLLIGDWFVLNQIKKNLEPDIFAEIANDLTKLDM